MRRRTFLAGAAGLAAAPVVDATAFQPIRLARGGSFPSGVVSGLPSTRGATLWTRVDELDPEGLVELHVATDPGFRRTVARRRIAVAASADNVARGRLSGLEPGQEYHYRFVTRDRQSPVGRFRTLRPPDSREPVRIGFFSCQRFEHGYFTAQAGLAAEDLDLVVSLGDYLYDEDTRPKLPERLDGSGGERGHAQTLAEWRAKHRRYRSDEFLQRMHGAHAFVPVWDDCEVEGNWAGENPTPAGGRDRTIAYLDKRRNAYRAFFENMPIPTVSEGSSFRLYRRIPLGANADLLMLDTRQYRDVQPCGDRELQPCADDNTPGRKRLGDAQKAWLKRELEGSRATWKVLGQAQMVMSLDLPPANGLQRDSWDGYGAERQEVVEHLLARGIRDVTVITGDVHAFFAGTVTTTGRASGRAAATEFVGTSISHDGQEDLFADIVGARSSAELTDQLLLANPHLRYANFGPRGYAVMEAGPDELKVDFKAVASVLEKRTDTTTIARFRVRRGSLDVERVG